METKKCYRCYEVCKLSDFPVRRGRPIGVCVECYRTHYGDPDIIEQKRISNEKAAYKRKQKINEKLILERLKEGCMDCGEKNYIVLEFDHREPSTKKHAISSMKGGATKPLVKELQKCDVVCANCHRIRTAKMFGNWRLSIETEA